MIINFINFIFEREINRNEEIVITTISPCICA